MNVYLQMRFVKYRPKKRAVPCETAPHPWPLSPHAGRGGRRLERQFGGELDDALAARRGREIERGVRGEHLRRRVVAVERAVHVAHVVAVLHVVSLAPQLQGGG